MTARQKQIEWLVNYFWDEYCDSNEPWAASNQNLENAFCDEFGDILNYSQWKDRIKMSAKEIGLKSKREYYPRTQPFAGINSEIIYINPY